MRCLASASSTSVASDGLCVVSLLVRKVAFEYGLAEMDAGFFTWYPEFMSDMVYAIMVFILFNLI